MLKYVSIHNYVLIDQLEIDFNTGFSAITGETGAGKSILLGALALLLGKRADKDSLMHQDKKCVIEAHFDIQNLDLQYFFDDNDLDNDNPCIVRREINAKGKSRAFINDSPVSLSTLKDLGKQLVDIHSQNQNSQIANAAFRLQLLDAFAQHKSLLNNYHTNYTNYLSLKKQLTELSTQLIQHKAEQEYKHFLWEEINKLQLQKDEQADLEAEQSLLQHSEDIMTVLFQLSARLNTDDDNINNELQQLCRQSEKISQVHQHIQTLHQRLTSAQIELQDIGEEAQHLQNEIEINPQRLELINERLSELFRLCQKHQLQDSNELIELAKRLEKEMAATLDIENSIKNTENNLHQLHKQLQEQAKALFAGRKKAIKAIETQIHPLIAQLNMPDAQLHIEAKQTQDLHPNGKDEYHFKFSANKGTLLGDIAKVASGGELSRLMLAIKYLLSQKQQLPTIIFDEIDTGVSGEIAGKLANIIQQLSQYMQVISITHLPQVAAKAAQHYKVYKQENGNSTNSSIQLLSTKERQTELASMLSGSSITISALQHAKSLLNEQKNNNSRHISK